MDVGRMAGGARQRAEQTGATADAPVPVLPTSTPDPQLTAKVLHEIFGPPEGVEGR